MKKSFHILASIILVFSMFSSLFIPTASAVDYNGDQYVTKVTMKTPEDTVIKDGDKMEVNKTYTLEYEWKIPDNIYKKGDKLYFSIPKEFMIVNQFTFGLFEGGSEVARANILGNTNTNYYIEMTFTTDYVSTHSNVSGTFNLQYKLNTTYVKEGDLEIKLPPDYIITVEVPPFNTGGGGGGSGAGAGNNTNSAKTVSLKDVTLKDPETGEFNRPTKIINWFIQLGREVLLGRASSFDEIESITIEDEPKDQEIIPFKEFSSAWSSAYAFQGGFFNTTAWQYGGVSEQQMNLKKNAIGGYYESFKMDILPKVKEFENLADKNNDTFRQYNLEYYTLPLDDLLIERDYENDAIITINYKNGSPESWKLSNKIAWSMGSGTITGNVASVEMKKIDTGSKQGLAGAKFDLYKYSRSGEFTMYKEGIVSDADGKVKAENLTTGDYQFREVKAPEGYELIKKAFDFEVTTADLGSNQVIDLGGFENSSETIEISVKKKWEDNENSDDKRPNMIKVQLYAGNEKYGDPEILANGDNWSHTWPELPKYKNGKEIVYEVKEVDTLQDGYKSDIKENKEGFDFYITNTRIAEKTEIEGTKKWVHNTNPVADQPKSVEIQLFADGISVSGKKQTLTEANEWKYKFDDLPKYKNEGNLINYTVAEVGDDPNYVSSVSGKDITNTYNPGNTSRTVVKSWNHGNNPVNKQPNEVFVQLYKKVEGGTETTEGLKVTLNVANSWTHTWGNLPIQEGDKKIEYTVKEEAVAGYTEEKPHVVSGETIYIKNVYNPESTQIGGKKIWNDNNNQDGKRPDKIEVNLLANGKQVDQLVVRAPSNDASLDWSYQFDNLPKYDENGEIEYTVKEEPIDDKDYTSTQSGNDFTNSYTPEKTEVAGKKVWQDNNNQDKKRPDKLVVKLFANKIDTGKTQEIETDKNEVAFKFTNLDKYENGKIIDYTVDEVIVNGYTKSIVQSDFTIYNTYTPETTEINGEKIWRDGDNRDGYREDSVQIDLYGDGVVVAQRTTTAKDGWKYSFTNLPKKKNGKDIEYTVKEATKIPEYTTTIDGYDVINTHPIETVDIGGTKTWTDNNNQDGKRKSEVTINLYANGNEVADSKKTISAATSWKYEYKDLPKKEKGKDIVYTVKEDAVTDYTTKYTGYDIENIHTPEKVDVKGKKNWVDESNRDGKRPENITVELYADGEPTGQKRTISSVKDEDTYEFTDLQKYKDGKLIVYTVKEEKVDEYTTMYDGYNIKNTRAPELIDIKGDKLWVDGENQDRIRPDEITVRLLADGKEVRVQKVTTENPSDEKVAWEYEFKDLPKYHDGGKLIKYTVKEDAVDKYGTTIDEFFSIVNTHTPEEVDVKGKKIWDDANDQDGKRPDDIMVELYADGISTGKTQIVSAEKNEQAYEFTNLPKFKKGVLIKYTVIEKTILPDYDTTYNGYEITNKYTPELIDIEGDKKWVDGENQDKVRPDEITVRLLADKKEVRVQKVTTDKPTDEKIAWEYKFKGVPKYRDHGTLIEYTVTEDPVDKYGTTIDEFFDIVNTHKPEEVDVKGKKVWDDANDQDGKRPEKIVVELYADGESTGEKQEVSAEKNEQAYEFTNLPKFKKGVEIKYTVKEVTKIDEYETSYDGFTITNKREPELIDIEGDKKWVDGENQDRIRPDKITVRLLADGKEVRVQDVTTDEPSDEKIAWEYKFKDLPKYRDHGTLIKYTVEEDPVDAYETTIDEFFKIVNTHKPEEVDVKGEKTWDDKNNQDGKRPEEITINLLADGEQIDERIVTEKDNWSYEFTNLPKYKKGDEIEYKVAEELIDEYSTTYDEPENEDVTNSYTPGVTARTVMKFWEDTDDQDGKRPDEITVQLYADGEKLREPIVLDEENDWLNTWEDLDEMKAGKTIVYTAKEVDVPGVYEVSIDDETTPGTFVLVNDYTTEVREIKGKKTWDDKNNQDGKRPETITVNLLADGEVIATQEVIEKDKWSYEFTDLPTYRDGEKIIYTVTEDQVEDYTTEIDDTNIINAYTPGKTSATVTKTWKDDNDKNGKRPTSISVQLYADGKAVGKKETLNKANKWTKTWTDLDEMNDGKEVVYTVKETTTIQDYEVSINDSNIGNMILTNKYVGPNACIPTTPTPEDPTGEDPDNPTPEDPTGEDPDSPTPEDPDDCIPDEPLVCEPTEEDPSGNGSSGSNSSASNVVEECITDPANTTTTPESLPTLDVPTVDLGSLDSANTNVPANTSTLPKTGSSNSVWYVVAGVIILLGGWIVVRKNRKNKMK